MKLSERAKLILIVAVAVVVEAAGVGALMTAITQIENQARMATIGIEVYWDVTGSQVCDYIDWGELTPGGNKTITVYVKNPGSLAITGSFNTSSWDPVETDTYITLSWDFGSLPLLPGRVRTTKLTLDVSPTIHDIESFYFVITVIGTEYV